jgi:hypothetical protein
LRFFITKKRIRADDKGIDAIASFPIPEKVYNVQSFLGLCSYFRMFIKDFSTLAKPLYDILRKDKEFSFEQRKN